MIRALSVSLAALIGAAPALGAEGGTIRSGEHAGFSRIVMLVEPTTEWSLETGPDRATIFFPGKALGFGLGAVFDKIPRTRITDVRTAAGAAGTSVEVDLGCDCRVSTSFVGARYLALDVSDRDAPPPEAASAEPAEPAGQEAAESSAADRAGREASIVASAEQVLIAQIERAVDQGIIALSEETGALDPAEPAPVMRESSGTPPAPDVPERPAAPAAPPAGPEAAAAEPIDPLAQMLDHDQIEAITVFDRDRRSITDRLRQAVPPECIADARLEVGRWSNGTGLFDQSPALAARLVGEFDAPDLEALAALSKLQIHFGFGLEAELLLAGFDQSPPDRPLLIDLARAVERRPLPDDGPLAMPAACPGRHGLWQAIGGAVPAYRAADHFATVQAAFEELPPALRALVGPTLIDRLLDEGRGAEARLIHDTTARPGIEAGPELRLSEARLIAAEGRVEAAVRALVALVEANPPNATDALMHLARLALDAGMPIPERTVIDLRAALLQHRGTDLEPRLRALLAETLAARAELGAAIAEIRAAKAAHPGTRAFDALAAQLLGAADPERVGAADYAEVVLASTDLVAPAPAHDAARKTIAGHLLDLGLARAAREMVAPAAARDDGARLTLARALLRTGEADKVRLVLTGLAGEAAAALRARSFALEGDFVAANATLAGRGLLRAAEPYAWPSGDWPRATAAAPEPDQRVMATYMAVRDGALAPPAPAADPAGLAPPEAFLAPLPRLDRPSLDSARRLLAAGRQVEDFVATVLAPAPEAPAR